jgi:hypothetical protein
MCALSCWRMTLKIQHPPRKKKPFPFPPEKKIKCDIFPVQNREDDVIKRGFDDITQIHIFFFFINSKLVFRWRSSLKYFAFVIQANKEI